MDEKLLEKIYFVEVHGKKPMWFVSEMPLEF